MSHILYSGGDICHKCWGFMTVAIKVINAALRGELRDIGLYVPQSLRIF